MSQLGKTCSDESATEPQKTHLRATTQALHAYGCLPALADSGAILTGNRRSRRAHPESLLKSVIAEAVNGERGSSTAPAPKTPRTSRFRRAAAIDTYLISIAMADETSPVMVKSNRQLPRDLQSVAFTATAPLR